MGLAAPGADGDGSHDYPRRTHKKGETPVRKLHEGGEEGGRAPLKENIWKSLEIKLPNPKDPNESMGCILGFSHLFFSSPPTSDMIDRILFLSFSGN